MSHVLISKSFSLDKDVLSRKLGKESAQHGTYLEWAIIPPRACRSGLENQQLTSCNSANEFNDNGYAVYFWRDCLLISKRFRKIYFNSVPLPNTNQPNPVYLWQVFET